MPVCISEYQGVGWISLSSPALFPGEVKVIDFRCQVRETASGVLIFDMVAAEDAYPGKSTYKFFIPDYIDVLSGYNDEISTNNSFRTGAFVMPSTGFAPGPELYTGAELLRAERDRSYWFSWFARISCIAVAMCCIIVLSSIFYNRIRLRTSLVIVQHQTSAFTFPGKLKIRDQLSSGSGMKATGKTVDMKRNRPSSHVTKFSFLKELMKVFDQHLMDRKFKIEDLGSELHMSRSQLFRKVKEASGLTPHELFRIYKMKHAARLLRKGGRNIAQVMYQVGMNNPSHFANSFRKYYGINPGTFRTGQNGHQNLVYFDN